VKYKPPSKAFLTIGKLGRYGVEIHGLEKVCVDTRLRELA
jgi:hypothetical protein